MLSGGVDSSALTALMAKVRGDADFHTFSLAFEDSSFDESPYAREVSAHLGTRHHEVVVTPEKVRELLPKYLCHIDEPFADGSAIPIYLLAECARDYVKVLLSGEGGDEAFAGYDTYRAYKIRKWYRQLPAVFRKKIITPLVNTLPVSLSRLSIDFKAKQFVRGAEFDVPTSHFYWRVVLSEDAKQQVLSTPYKVNAFTFSDQLFVDEFKSANAADDLNKLMYVDCYYHLPDDLMVKNDRMTMAHS